MTVSQARLRVDNVTGYRGVDQPAAAGGRYRAQIKLGQGGGRRKAIHLGYFDDPVDAAHAYDVAADKYFGKSASLNFPDDVS